MMTIYILMAAAVAAISYTVTMTYAFEWWRNFIKSLGWSFFIKLFTCPWCLSHWVLAFFMPFLEFPIIYGVKLIIYGVKLNFIIDYFSILSLSGLFLYVLLRAFEPVAKASMKDMFNRKPKPAHHEVDS